MLAFKNYQRKFSEQLILLLCLTKVVISQEPETSTSPPPQKLDGSQPDKSKPDNSHTKPEEDEPTSEDKSRLPLKIDGGGIVEFTTDVTSTPTTTTTTNPAISTTLVAALKTEEKNLEHTESEGGHTEPGNAVSKEPNSMEECTDHAENCSPNAEYCKERSYRALMRRHCTRTCGYCADSVGAQSLNQSKNISTTNQPRHPDRHVLRRRPFTGQIQEHFNSISINGNNRVNEHPLDSTEPSDGCVDVSPRCELWNEHNFCNSTFFVIEVKQKFCSRTCNLCNVQQHLPQPKGQENSKENKQPTKTT
ncbi:shK domain-like domain-containing protein [Ditylenchus destructor]|nr:shK domain-like domain-containing protein [Ditylenchus destructor]